MPLQNLPSCFSKCCLLIPGAELFGYVTPARDEWGGGCVDFQAKGLRSLAFMWTYCYASLAICCPLSKHSGPNRALRAPKGALEGHGTCPCCIQQHRLVSDWGVGVSTAF